MSSLEGGWGVLSLVLVKIGWPHKDRLISTEARRYVGTKPPIKDRRLSTCDVVFHANH